MKDRLGHGQFLNRIDECFGWSDRHARRLMEVYANIKLDNLSDLNIDVSALYLIAAPKTSEPFTLANRALRGRTRCCSPCRVMRLIRQQTDRTSRQANGRMILFMTQSVNRIHLCGPPRWDNCCHRGYNRHDHSCGTENQGVCRFDAI